MIRLLKSLTIAGLFWLGLTVHAQAAIAVGALDNCAASGHTAGSTTCTLTTVNGAGKVVCVPGMERTTTQASYATVSVADAAGANLTWHEVRGWPQQNHSPIPAYTSVDMWYADASGNLTADPIVFTYTASGTNPNTIDNAQGACVLVTGLDSVGSDVNASLPYFAVCSTCGSNTTLTTGSNVSTTSTATIILGVAVTSASSGAGAAQTVGSGFTIVGTPACQGGGTGFICVALEYDIVASAQTNIAVLFGTSQKDWMVEADAFCASCASGASSQTRIQGTPF